MLKNLPIEKIFKTALSGGGEVSELFIEQTNTTSVLHEDKKIEKINAGADTGYGLRVTIDDKTAYGFTNDPGQLMQMAGALADGCKHITGKKRTEPNKLAPSPFPLPSATLPADRRGERVVTESIYTGNNSLNADKDKIATINMAADIAWSFSPHIKQVQINWRNISRHIWIANSQGTLVEDKKNDTTMVVLVVAQKDGTIQTGYEPASGSFSPQTVAESAAKRAILMLSADHSPRGMLPVVISSSAGGTMIHEAVGHGLEADLVIRGLSVYKDKIGKQVASNLVTVIDDATMPDFRGSFAYDDEGTIAQRTTLIENGVLKRYMQSRATAARLKMEPTGNCRRESYRNRPIVRMTNTFVAPGKDEPEAIIESVADGLLVKKMGGGQVNTINGDFVFEAQEAYLIKNGRIGNPVRGATLIGNGPKVLLSIDMVGTDLGFGIGTCGKEGQGVPVGHGMPTVRIPSITVGGTG